MIEQLKTIQTGLAIAIDAEGFVDKPVRKALLQAITALTQLEAMVTQQEQEQEPVAWQILNGVCHAGIRSSEASAKEAAAGMQKTHDLGGSLAAFHVRPLYAAPVAQQYEAGDVASAAAQGFRDGVASVTQQEPVAWIEHHQGSIAYNPYPSAARQLPDGVRFDLYTAAPVAQQPQAEIRKADVARTCPFCNEEWVEQPQAECRSDGRCQYAIDHGAEGLGHCPKGKCVLPEQPQAEAAEVFYCKACGCAMQMPHDDCLACERGERQQPQAEAVPADQSKWCAYVAGVIGCYLGEADDSAKVKAIAGIIERRMWASAHQPLKIAAWRGVHVEGDYLYYDEFPEELTNEQRRQLHLKPLYEGAAPQQAEAVPSDWRSLLRQSEDNFVRQFGVSVSAAWAYRDMEDLFAAAPQQAEAVPSDVARIEALEASNVEDKWIVGRNKDSFTVALSYRGSVTRQTLREAIDAAIAQQKGGVA